MTNVQPQPQIDPRAEIYRPGDIWVSVGKPMLGMGAMKVRMNPEFLFFERGTLRTDAQQVPVIYIHDVDAMQSMTQKMRMVGSIRVTVTRPGRAPEYVLLEDLPDYRDGVEHINRVSRASRIAEQQRAARLANTQHINYMGQHVHQQVPPPPQFQQQPQSHLRAQPQIQAQPQPQPQLSARPQADSTVIFGQIERLGELRDKGFITAQDFDLKKAELLQSL